MKSTAILSVSSTEPARPKNPWTSSPERLPYLDVEWGAGRFVQIQYAAVIDLFFKDNVIRIVSSRYYVTIKIAPPEGKEFDLSKFRKEFQTGMVMSLCERPDLGFSIRVQELTKLGLTDI